MKTKFANRLIAVIITAVMTIMCCISPQSLRFDEVLPEKVEIQAYAEDTKSSDYDKAMQLYEEKCYEWLNGNGVEEITYDSHFQVFDLSWDEDGIPELIITPSIARGANCYVYMYYNGEIFEKKYTLPNTGGSFEYCEQTNTCKFETRHQGVIEIDLMSFCVMYESWEGIKRSSELSNEPLTYQYYNSASTFDITKEEFEKRLAEIENYEWITVGNEYGLSKENVTKVFGTKSSGYEWQNAYADVLRDYISSDVPATAKFSLCYIDDNDIPELVVHSNGCAAHADTEVYLYTFYNNEIKNLGQISNDGYSNFTYYEKKGIVISGWLNQGAEISNIHNLLDGNINVEHIYTSNKAAIGPDGYSEFDDVRSDDADEKYKACLPDTDPIHDKGEYALTEENISLYLSDNSGNNSNVELSDLIDTKCMYYADWFEGDDIAVARYITTLKFENNSVKIVMAPTIALPDQATFEIGEMTSNKVFKLNGTVQYGVSILKENIEGTLTVIDDTTIQVECNDDVFNSKTFISSANPQYKVNKEDEVDWKNIYKDALYKLIEDKWTMEDNSSFNGSRFDLYELNGDDIPELFVTHDNASHAEGIIFSIVNGKLTKSSVGVYYGSITVSSAEHMVCYNAGNSYLPSPNYYRFSEGVLYDVTDSGENFDNITFESTGFKYSFDKSIIEEVFSLDSDSNLTTQTTTTQITTTTATTQTITSSTTGVTTTESDNLEYQQKFVDKALDYIDSNYYNSLVRDGFYYDAVLSRQLYTFENAKNLLSNNTTRTLINTFDSIGTWLGDEAIENTGYDYLFNQMMLNNDTYEGFQNAFELNVFMKTLDLFKEIAENGSDFLKKYGISTSDIEKAIKNFEEALDSGDNNKIETSMSELFDIIPKNADTESVKNLFKTMSYEVGNTIGIIGNEIDEVLNQIKVATDFFDYVIYAEAYKSTCKEFGEILLTVADYIDSGLYNGDIATHKELKALSSSIRKYIAAMKSYSEENYSSIALKSIELELKVFIDEKKEFLKEKFAEVSIKALGLGSNAFLAFKVGYKCLDMVLEQGLSLEQMKKSGEIIHGYELISSVLYGAITNNKFENSIQKRLVDNSSYENALLFNEAVKLKQIAQLLAMDSAIDYYVSCTKKEFNAVNRNDNMRYNNELAIKDLQMEKAIFGSICIPENYATLDIFFQQHINDLNAAIIMCPVNVTIKSADGSTAAFLSNETVDTTDMYRYICDTYETDRDVKVILFAEDDEVLISGEGEGEMNVIILGKNDKYYEFSGIPVTNSMKVHISELNDDRAVLDYTSDTLNTNFICEASIQENTTSTSITTTTSTSTTTATTAESTTTTINTSVVTGTCGDNLTWEYDGNGVLTISGTGDMYDYDDLTNYSPWNRFMLDLKKVIIENGVTSIGKSAFSSYSNLTEISIPDSVVVIGESAFSSCSNLTEIFIPDSVVVIGEFAFSSCSNLTEISIPNGVDSIPYGAFIYCSGLTKVSISDSVVSIQGAAFNGCSTLTSVIIPKNVKSIGFSAFGGSLDSVIIENPDCEIYYTNNTFDKETVIYGYMNSTAQEYAEEYNRTFVTLDSDNTTTTTQTIITETTTTTSNITAPIEPSENKLGDVNGDNMVDAVDASFILQEYALLSTGGSGSFTDIQKSVADINSDGMTDAVDASLVLQYYAYVSTGGKESSEEFFGKK